MKIVQSIICFIVLFLMRTVVGQPNFWQEIGTMPYPVAGGRAIAHHAKIYILGGFSDAENQAIDLIQVYDPATAQWDTLGHMLTPRTGLVADKFADSLIICGGVSPDSQQATILEMWNLNSRPYRYGEDENFVRLDATGGVTNGMLYIFGGYSPQFYEGLRLPYLAAYDIPQNTIVYVDSLYRDVLPYQQMSAFVDTEVYLFGGVYNGISKRVYTYNLNEKRFERTFPDLYEARAAGTAARNAFEIYIIGGYNEENAALSSMEIYRVYQFGNISDYGPNLTYARKDPMCAIIDNTIYTFGGRDENGDIVPIIEALYIGAATEVVQHSVEPATKDFDLLSNYPNPFNTQTKITFRLSAAIQAHLGVFTLSGRLVRTLANGDISAGTHEIIWDGKDNRGQQVASNIYLVVLVTEQQTLSKKIILIR